MLRLFLWVRQGPRMETCDHFVCPSHCEDSWITSSLTAMSVQKLSIKIKCQNFSCWTLIYWEMHKGGSEVCCLYPADLYRSDRWGNIVNSRFYAKRVSNLCRHLFCEDMKISFALCSKTSHYITTGLTIRTPPWAMTSWCIFNFQVACF